MIEHEKSNKKPAMSAVEGLLGFFLAPAIKFGA